MLLEALPIVEASPNVPCETTVRKQLINYLVNAKTVGAFFANKNSLLGKVSSGGNHLGMAHGLSFEHSPANITGLLVLIY